MLQQSHDAANLDLARKEFEAELLLNPFDAVAEYQVGQILTAGQAKVEAAAHFERATAIRPDFAEALIAVAKLRTEAKRYADAIALLERGEVAATQRIGAVCPYDGLSQCGPNGGCGAGKSGIRQAAVAAGWGVCGFSETAR